jgi:hypothetical protein
MRCHRDRQPIEHMNLRELPATVDCLWDKAHIGDSDREESICEECLVRLLRPLSRALLLALLGPNLAKGDFLEGRSGAQSGRESIRRDGPNT